MALRILHQLVRMQAAVDGTGNPLQPLPIVHRALASPQCLPHIAPGEALCSCLVSFMPLSQPPLSTVVAANQMDFVFLPMRRDFEFLQAQPVVEAVPSMAMCAYCCHSWPSHKHLQRDCVA